MGYEVVVLAFSSEDGPIWTMRPSFVIALPHLEWVDASRPSVIIPMVRPQNVSERCSFSRPEPSDRRGGSLSFLPFRFQEPNPLVDVGINRMIRLGKITRRKQGSANMLHVVVADGVRKNR